MAVAMSKISLSGNPSGSGVVTLAAPNTNSTVTLNLPDTAGTVLIQDGTNTTTVVNLTATGTVNVGGGNISPQTGFKNRIINGAMTIDQRNAGASVTPAASTYTLDRWRLGLSVASKVSVQQSSVAPAGFANSTLITSLSAYTITGAEEINLGQRVEGFNSFDLNWGTANAQAITFSFWVRSSLTGLFSGAVKNNGATRTYVFSYTINAANTWEYKTVTIPGDTTGTWNITNEIGLIIQFCIASATLLNAAGVWYGTNMVGVTGTTQLVATNGATWYVTGVQLEKGSVATPFEFRSIGQELALCQRYYEFSSLFQVFSGYVVTGEIYYNPVRFSVTKRAAPTVVAGATNGVTLFVVRFPTTALTTAQINSDGYYAQSTANATGTGYYQYSWTASAEL
jgi:hypothetical protein